MLLRQRVERAVGQDDLAVAKAWFIAVALEHAQQCVATLRAARAPPGFSTRGSADRPSRLDCGGLEGGTDRHALGGGSLDRLRKQAAGEVVAAGRQGDLDLAFRAPVDLCGSAGAGSGASREPLEVDLGEAGLDELVEMER